ncbi:MAG: heme-binding domain-containing protein [Acidobacteriota bacterium]
MKNILRWAIISLALLFVVLQFVRPAKTNPMIDDSRALHNQTEMNQEVTAVIKRACYDCHSNDTRWPWYSNIAPVSWFVIDHVNHGRKHLNFSNWADYDKQQKATQLFLIGETVRLGKMPMSSYTLMHADAQLTDDDKKLIAEWVKAEKAKLFNQPQAQSFVH